MNFGGNGACTCGKVMKGGGGSFGGNISTTWRTCECGIKALFYSVREDYEIGVRAEHKDKRENQEKEKEKLLSVFKLAEIEVKRHWDIKNDYCGGEADWLLVDTNFGFITIGWRKRVIAIDWSDTGVKYLVEDDVTKDEDSCHAWGYDKAVTYLTGLGRS